MSLIEAWHKMVICFLYRHNYYSPTFIRCRATMSYAVACTAIMHWHAGFMSHGRWLNVTSSHATLEMRGVPWSHVLYGRFMRSCRYLARAFFGDIARKCFLCLLPGCVAQTNQECQRSYGMWWMSGSRRTVCRCLCPRDRGRAELNYEAHVFGFVWVWVWRCGSVG